MALALREQDTDLFKTVDSAIAALQATLLCARHQQPLLNLKDLITMTVLRTPNHFPKRWTWLVFVLLWCSIGTLDAAEKIATPTVVPPARVQLLLPLRRLPSRIRQQPTTRH